MPIVTVSHRPGATPTILQRLEGALPEIVARALDCAEERYHPPLQKGDVNLRFVPALTAKDGVDWLIEVRTRAFPSRSADVASRAEKIRTELNRLDIVQVGVWIELPTGGWAQD